MLHALAEEHTCHEHTTRVWKNARAMVSFREGMGTLARVSDIGNDLVRSEPLASLPSRRGNIAGLNKKN
jgi:hypothetical protein